PSLSSARNLHSFPTRRSSDLKKNILIEKTLLLIARAFSSVIFIVLKYVLRYRYGVIRKNLQRAFPEKAERERQRLMDHYYAHMRSEEHTSELQSRENLVCRLL